MNITIVGLGLIGASYAKGLTEKGYKVFGVDNNQETCEFALKNGFVFGAANTLESFIQETDLLVVALYPKQIVSYLKENQHLFNEKLVITDVCGVKSSICEEAFKASLPAHFVGSHPMAGKEKSGIEYANPKIFENANFLITPLDNTPDFAIEKVKEVANALGFGSVHVISPKHHDEMIAYTSQLTHAIAVSLVNSDSDKDTKDFIGDSYRDLTRIAMINEKLWSELFFANKDILNAKIDTFISELEKIKMALESDNYDELNTLFKSSREKRCKMQ